MKYIADIIDRHDLVPNKFNLIASGTGTGKTEFIRRKLPLLYPEIKPCEILVVTSRSMIRDQQGLNEDVNAMLRINLDDMGIVRYWNNEDYVLKEEENVVHILNLNTFGKLIDSFSPRGAYLPNVKIVVFDECHSLFSDEYIAATFAIRVWIRQELVFGNRLIIGLTATPGIVDSFGYKIGNVIHDVLPANNVRYKAQHLTVTRFEHVVELYNERFYGQKVIILCKWIKDCRKLKEQIPKSEILCSRGNDNNTPRMDAIRNHILMNKALPTAETITKEEKAAGVLPINVLISTDTMREGINLSEESGIKAVICCLGDELHVVQFVGRCRFNVENLIVAYKHYASDNGVYSDEMNTQRYVNRGQHLLLDYIEDKSNRKWFDTIKHIVETPFEEIDRYKIDTDVERFVEEFDKRWTVDTTIPTKMQVEKLIRKEDHPAVMDLARECNLFGSAPELFYTFNSIAKYLCDKLGYGNDVTVVSINGKKQKYKYFFRRSTNEEE